MKRTITTSVGIATLALATLAPSVAASATPSAPTSSASAFDTRPPWFRTVNGHAAYNDRFTFDEGPNMIVLSGADQPGSTVRVYDTEDNKTLCTADNQSAPYDRGVFRCTVATPPRYGLTSIAATITSPDGTETSEVSATKQALRVYSQSEMTLDSYDETTKVAHVSGTSLADTPFSIWTNGELSSEKIELGHGTVRPDGTWSATLTDIEPATKLAFELPDIAESNYANVWIPDGAPLPTPTVGVTSVGSSIRLAVGGGSEGMSVVVRDSAGRLIAGTAVTGSTAPTVVTIPNPGVERQYRVYFSQRSAKSPEVTLTVNPGLGSAEPAAPSVMTASLTGSRMTATVAADAGSVVRVTDTAGTTVALRIAGASGRASLVFTTPTTQASGSYEVTQTVAGATSAATPLTT